MTFLKIIVLGQQACPCSKSTTEALKYFTPFSSTYIFQFEQINICWEVIRHFLEGVNAKENLRF